ncbi:hypothetical protein K435DRAFT_759191 [Dendrothele bispora CBS 962.96]|uniref:Sacsin/Nov domain-containing protein n=1 Tax=Dendrothele bispora (strain CBS 962.96) TaxID=1314807 RepID=A0A4S8LRC1_DENBC|nr:hypothetical protein K435DRAFT_759191 [Dendrothele bispora CBS 962.96]
MALQARDALWASGHDESVEVNQRALIDKVLARYSGEFTVFRELLQNSDDAQSKSVEIRFETKQHIEARSSSSLQTDIDSAGRSLPDLKTTNVHQWTFKNNGIVFRNEDWSRLKKIAEGNPDEEKIGAFGVGFYSLFSVTEEPFVTSGGQWMGFYWKDKKDQLFARRGNLPDTDGPPDGWTSFEMLLREPAPIPVAFDFTRFLASSITFMSYLSEISVYFDDKRLVKLSKTSSLPKQLKMPQGIQTSSKLKVMNITNLKSTPLHIKAEVLAVVHSSGTEKPPPPSATKSVKPPSSGGFFSSLFAGFPGVNTPQRSSTPAVPQPQTPPVNPLSVIENSVLLSIFTADVDVRLERKITAELHRSTKKNPPSKLKYELIYTGKDQYDASKKEDEQQSFITGSIFQGLRADLEGTGSARVFIGHATGQTTGIGGHMSSRFIPTVERESIDLMDRNVAIWNRELLFVGGVLARAAYELELRDVQMSWDGALSPSSSDLKPELRSWLIDKSIHALRFFTFHQSTPSAEVSSLLESAFFTSSGNNFTLLSTVGVRNISEIRLPDPSFSFLKQLPVVPEEVMTEARPMVTALQHRQLIKPITFDDVLKELRSRPLDEADLIACMEWWVKINGDGNHTRYTSIRTQLLDAAVLTMSPGTLEEKIIPLNTIRTFLNPRNQQLAGIPPNAPLPEHMLPFSISKKFSPDALLTSFGFRELTLVEWLQHLCSSSAISAKPEFDLNLSAPWAEQVLGVLARAWPTLADESKGQIVSILGKKTCIPTTNGLKVPAETYFANANIFHDLPVVTLPSGASIKSSMERVLTSLGVRKHVDLQIIFTRMIKTNEWTIPDLIKYLVSVQSTLSADEWQRLKLTAAFSPEVKDADNPTKRFRASELYEPLDVFRHLGLPVIDWGNQYKWRSTSVEAKFLFELGLRRYPPLRTLVNLCASSSPDIRSSAFQYLIDNVDTKYKDYQPADYKNDKFIPALKDGKPYLGSLDEVYANSEWVAFGFPVLAPTAKQFASKLHIRDNPPSSLLVELLRKTAPKDVLEATKWFEILAGHLADLNSPQLNQLSQMPIVPIPQAKGGIKHLQPVQCYFGRASQDNFHSKLFTFIDFGALANNFLSACGAKKEPNVDEIAQMLLADPFKFYDAAGGPNNFLNELRNIAVNRRGLTSTTLARLKKSPVLLGSQRKLLKNEKVAQGNDYDDEEWELQYDLKRPDQIIVADDANALQLFGNSLFCAPQEDILEDFYVYLGSRRLSSIVKEDHKTSVEVPRSKTAQAMRDLILERLPLFLHEYTHAKTKVSFNWLNGDGNFVVKTFGKLTVTKSLFYGDLRLTKSQDASAVAKRFGYGPIQLWLAENVQQDMYEVATSLNRLFFESPKANDALLFMTILSTDLRSLKRRGYNVDRILREQRVKRQAAEDAEKARAQALAQAQAPTPPLMSKPPQPSIPGMFPPTETPPQTLPNPAATSTSLRNPIPVPEKEFHDDKVVSKVRPQSIINQMQQFKNRFTGKHGTDVPDHDGPSFPTTTSLPLPLGNSPQRPNSHRNPTQGATPISNIHANIDMAVRACRPESGSLLRNREHMQQVKETLDEGYCDISGRAGDLKQIGQMGEVSVYLSEEVPQIDTFMATKRNSMARFIYIMKDLGEIYKLPLTSMHIFYDLGGGLIAFNRNGSIFLNLRYFEAWHDADVAAGNTSAAYISWFFTLAHEIAHNLVQPHNSEHEFYFSAICEKHIMDLQRKLHNDRKDL